MRGRHEEGYGGRYREVRASGQPKSRGKSGASVAAYLSVSRTAHVEAERLPTSLHG